MSQPPSNSRRIHVVGAALLRRGKVMAARRAPHVGAAGRWEFPGGKIEAGESPREALCRELREELRLDLRADEIGEHLGRGSFRGSRLVIVLDVYAVAAEAAGVVEAGWIPALTDHDRIRWLDAETLFDVDWAEADRPVLPRLRQLLSI